MATICSACGTNRCWALSRFRLERSSWAARTTTREVSTTTAAPSRGLTFFIARYQVTLAQFSAFVRGSGYKPADPDCLTGAPNCSVAHVTWHDAMAFCRWLTTCLRGAPSTPVALRDALTADPPWEVVLPSEAEWERVARGTRARRYPWGDDIDPNRETSPVGAFPKGRTPLDEGAVEDLSGNVWEWTRSVFRAYPYVPLDGREDVPAHGPRVLRGGSFNFSERYVRGACRYYYGPRLSEQLHRVSGGGLPFLISDRWFRRHMSARRDLDL